MKKVIFIFTLSFYAQAESTGNGSPLSLFGSKPIQIQIGKDGILQQKTPGFVCELKASLGGAQYSEWGQTEADAREIVTQKCSRNSGMLLCKKSNAVCKQEAAN